MLSIVLCKGLKPPLRSFYFASKEQDLVISRNVFFIVRMSSGESYNSDCLQSSVKQGGGSAMVWSCMPAVRGLIKTDEL